jgi:hypothetical protein
VDRITRKELKTDKFAQEVTHTFEYVGAHRRAATKYTIAAVVVVVLAIGFWVWRSRAAETRQRDLAEAMRVQEAAVAPPSDNPLILTFRTQAEKEAAAVKAFNGFLAKHSGSDEASIARFYLGVVAADAGKVAEAEKSFQEVASNGTSGIASLAKLALSQIYASQNKIADAEKQLRALIANPTPLVSKEQATISLAHVLAQSNPAEARKLLEPLRDGRNAVSRSALTALSELPAR